MVALRRLPAKAAARKSEVAAAKIEAEVAARRETTGTWVASGTQGLGGVERVVGVDDGVGVDGGVGIGDDRDGRGDVVDDDVDDLWLRVGGRR